MASLVKTLGNVALVEFVAVAVLALWHAIRHHSKGATWAAATFSLLATIAAIGKVLEHSAPHVPPMWVFKVLVAALLLIPFFFYKFAAAFVPPAVWVRRTAVAITVAAIAWTVRLPYFPLPKMPQPSWYVAYRVGISVQWGFLFTFVAVRLWSAGARQPSAARARMRLLAAGAAGLDVQIVLGALGLTAHPSVALFSQATTVVMAVLFVLGFTLPTSIRSIVRRHARDAVTDALADLVRVGSPAEVAEHLLPHLATFVGASRIAWLDGEGREVAHHGDEPGPHTVCSRLGGDVPLVVWTSPYIPFFARDEIRMLTGVAHLLELVLERFRLADLESEAQLLLEHQALHDDLTGLPNRTLFLDRLEQSMAKIERHRSMAAVMFIDLDHFKTINDGIDHAAGDAVLIETAARLDRALRSGDTVARFGGDEFVVLAEVGSDAEAVSLAHRLRQWAAAPMVVAGRDLSVTASVGVVVTSQPTDAGDLVRDADSAMYQAKSLGRDRVELFSEQVRTLARERLELDRELRQAFGTDQIRLEYQPIVRLSDGCFVGYEALLRWHHPERGVLLPARFVPMAEESGLIVELDAWVVREAARQTAEWRRTMPHAGPFIVWVNKSAGSFHRGDPVAVVSQALNDTGASAADIGIEITEGVFMSAAGRVGDAIAELKQLGVSIAIDDFGTGFSSLGYLKRFPVDVLKIDSSFVTGIGTEPETSLVTACLALAESLGIRAVAEGVEDQSHREWLVNAGCTYAQGYLFSRPLNAQAAGLLLASATAA